VRRKQRQLGQFEFPGEYVAVGLGSGCSIDYEQAPNPDGAVAWHDAIKLRGGRRVYD
jgi:hypothetical protein